MRHGVCLVLIALLASELLAGPQQQSAGDRSAAPADDGDSILGAPSAFDLSGEQEDLVRVEPDTRIYQEPALRSAILGRVEVAVELPVVERRGGWARVRHGSWQGWVPLAGEEAGPVTAAPAAPTWAPPAESDPERLRQARRFLTVERVMALGPYILYTDVTDDELLADLARVAARHPEHFRRRFGLAAVPGEEDSVVLYAVEAAYREYARTRDKLGDLDSSGHAIGGLAVLSVGERRRGEVRSLLIHELTHLLSFRALGPNLPAWLAEGLAEDLAYCRVTESGELLLATLDGWRAASTETVRGPDGHPRLAMKTMRGGPRVSLDLLRSQWREPERPRLEVLLELPIVEFTDSQRRSIHYAMSGFLVRYLLAHDELAVAFRAFLTAVARGGRGDGDDLIGHLGIGWSTLESGFGKWLASPAPMRGPKKQQGKP